MEACPKKTPFITVVRGGVFNDKTNYIELNKKNRQKVDAKKQSKIVNTASTSSVSTSTQTSATSVSTSTQTSATIEDQNVSFTIVDSEINLETVALEAGVGVISVTNEPSETQEANAGIAPMESQELEIIPSVEINETNLNNSDSIQVESSDSISPDALITAKTDESELNSTFQLLALTENDQQEPVNSLVASSSCEASASDSAEKTPHKTSLENSLNYVSPFVTLSRGKYSAQKEGKVREVKVIKNNEFVPASSELQTFIEADREKLKESQRSEEASSNSKGNRHPMVLRITPARLARCQKGPSAII